MTNQELNARAAEIMGWELVSRYWVTKGPNRQTIGFQDTWNPCENIAQAFELAIKTGLGFNCGYDLQMKNFYCDMYGDDYEDTWEYKSNQTEHTLALTITRACVATAERK